MRRYEGRREGHAIIVTVNGRPLNPRLDLYNHSPDGFEWGYGGSGPAQLALAIIADHLGNGKKAFEIYHDFKWAVVANMPYVGWKLTSRDVEQALNAIRQAKDAKGGAA
jgi:Family of unknown function (DUF6166)